GVGVGENRGVWAAVRAGGPVLCLYLLDEDSAGLRPLGGAARWWLAGSLRALGKELHGIGGRLVLRRGAAARIVPSLAAEVGAGVVYWNRRYDAAGIAVDSPVAPSLSRH